MEKKLFSYKFFWFLFELIFFNDMFIKGYLGYLLTCVDKGVLGNTQDYTNSL